ncbi:MAG: hypothetical protein JRI49_09430 [Deltaproteobacteria bacterium]|nr:hypothetical protein [Deltaproteobacteria bacterium]
MAESEVEQLKQRIDTLEKELREVKDLLKQQQQSREEESARVEKLEQKVEKSSSNVISSFKFKPYGFIKLDASYDDSRTNYGNFVFFIPNESAHKDDNEFNITARQTRLGMHIIAPDTYDWRAWGRIEIDFYGDGARHENKGAVLLRHAFVQLEKGNFSLLAGQTSDLISPLYPNTLNYVVGWTAGNIGYRRPQLRATYVHPFNEDTKLISALAIARSTGTVNEDLDLDLQNDGEDAGFPTVQARVALATKIFTRKHTVFGVNGHYGEEEIDWKVRPIFPGTRQERVKSWSANGDFDIPLTEKVALKGEVFVGYNLDDYLGGVLQGVNPTTQEVVKTAGGWMQLSYKNSDKWKYHLGFGIDDPKNNDLSSGMRSRNSFYFGNVVYSLIPPVDIGLEYSTGYKHRLSISGKLN